MLDQVAGSAVNAGAVFVLAPLLTAEDFGTFSLFQAVVVSSVVLQRALFCEPALALSARSGSGSPWLAWITVIFAVNATLAAFSLLFGGLLVLSLGAANLIYDVLRYRAFAQGRIVTSFAANTVWLGAFLIAILLLAPHDLTRAMIVWSATSALAACVLLGGGSRRESFAVVPSFRQLKSVLRNGIFSFLDNGLAAIAALAPLAVVGTLVSSSLVGAYRLAQAAFGPLSIAAGYVMISMLLDAERVQTSAKSDLTSRCNKAGWRLSVLTAAYAGLVGGLLLVYSRTLPQATLVHLPSAFIATAICAVLSAYATAYIACLRALVQTRYALKVRALSLVPVLAAMIVGLCLFNYRGWDPVLAPVVTTGVATLLAWTLAWLRLELPHPSARHER